MANCSLFSNRPHPLRSINSWTTALLRSRKSELGKVKALIALFPLKLRTSIPVRSWNTVRRAAADLQPRLNYVTVTGLINGQ